MKFPTYKAFLEQITENFLPENQTYNAIHKLALLKQGRWSVEEVITDFQLLVSQAGYTSESTTDNLHLIEKLQNVLKPSLVKKIMMLDTPPTDIKGWMKKAVMINSQYRMTMEILGRWLNEGKTTTSTRTSTNRTTWNDRTYEQKKPRRDPDAMDVDTMTTEERTILLRQGACFLCKEPGHMARDCKKKGKAPQKKTLQKSPIEQIHALSKGLSLEDKKKLMALQTSEEEKKEDNLDF